jgi:hypothetical protein
MMIRLLNAQPWRFKPGDSLYVRGWPENHTVKVVDWCPIEGCLPHYLVMDQLGAEWRLPQIHLSRRPLPPDA